MYKAICRPRKAFDLQKKLQKYGIYFKHIYLPNQLNRIYAVHKAGLYHKEIWFHFLTINELV